MLDPKLEATSVESRPITGDSNASPDRELLSSDAEKRSQAPGDVERAKSSIGEGDGFRGLHDPFANEENAECKYKTMVWWQASMCMVAETISLGILSLPKVLSVLGLIPGVICILGLGALSTYSGYVIGQFKLRYPHVHSMADAGEVLLGSFGREFFAIMMNAITEHATCTVVFTIVGMILSLLFTLPRTLKNLSYWSIASFVSIVAAVMIAMVGVSVTKPSKGNFDLFPRKPQFYEAFLAVANIVFAYAGHVAFFSFISELKVPTDFPKALCLLQVSDISMYLVSAVVIYYFAGSEVASPALDSASTVVRKVAYGIAAPTIIIAGVVNGHVAVKYIYVRLFRSRGEEKKDLMHQKSFKAYAYWIGICLAFWVVAWIIAEAVPVFNDLLGLTSALFASWFTYGLSALFWMHLNKGKWFSSWQKILLFLANAISFIVGLTICVVGLYSSGKSISINASNHGVFSCADNSGKPHDSPGHPILEEKTQ